MVTTRHLGGKNSNFSNVLLTLHAQTKKYMTMFFLPLLEKKVLDITYLIRK